ncbi:MAG: NAD(P)/FAD-dependent oxidoreductase [Woeseiaceae bacterium]|nr:NAD(P)/FAD-dependent oxidoreductase [Woeseiaceae bacterium]
MSSKSPCENGKVTGVALSTGEEIEAKIVVSGMDVKNTFLRVHGQVGPPRSFPPPREQLQDPRLVRQAEYRAGRDADVPGIAQGQSRCVNGFMHFTDTMERMERAYDDWKEGTWSKDPYVDMMIPTVTDPTMAPPGKHFMSCFVQYCPPKWNGRDWTDEERDQFGQTVIDQIAKFSPDFKDLILHVEVRTPREIENEAGLTEGNIFHGELTMDQLLFNRPVPGYAQYRGPVGGLYMCGSSTHPGGGVMSAPGANAAREILRDLKRPSTVPENFGDD